MAINLEKLLQRKAQQILKAAGKQALKAAQDNFNNAEYAGTNDVTVTKTQVDENTIKITATGTATNFIEFGTGINYPNSHPEAIEHDFIHGTYGNRHGANLNGWIYTGETGNAPDTYELKSGAVHTLGNKANLCMYNAREEVKNKYAR